MRPETEAALADMIKAATGPLRIRGGGTRLTDLPGEGTVLETAGLQGITLYEPGALTLVAQAGTALADIEAALDKEGQRLAFEPMDHRGILGTTGTPTIGGAVAANVSGPRRIQAGACRDHMLGVRFVDGAGTVIKNGGRVMKNVTGYDLVKLMTGSWGTLGVLTEVSLKVLPKPEAAATLTLSGLSIEAAVAAMARAVGSPYEITGAAYLPGNADTPSETLLRIEGFDASVAYRASEIAALFKDQDLSVERDGAKVAERWAGLRDVAALQGQAGDMWRVSCKPSDAPALIGRMGATAYQCDWAGGLVWALMPEGHDLRQALGAFDGHATLVRGAASTRAVTPMFHPEPKPLAILSQGIRDRLNPRGILNPGLMSA